MPDDDRGPMFRVPVTVVIPHEYVSLLVFFYLYDLRRRKVPDLCTYIHKAMLISRFHLIDNYIITMKYVIQWDCINS